MLSEAESKLTEISAFLNVFQPVVAPTQPRPPSPGQAGTDQHPSHAAPQPSAEQDGQSATSVAVGSEGQAQEGEGRKEHVVVDRFKVGSVVH